MAFKLFRNEERPYASHELTARDFCECIRLQKEGWTLGEIAEHFEITIVEAERQLGIRHDWRGRASYRGAWCDPAKLAEYIRGAACQA